MPTVFILVLLISILNLMPAYALQTRPHAAQSAQTPTVSQNPSVALSMDSPEQSKSNRSTQSIDLVTGQPSVRSSINQNSVQSAPKSTERTSSPMGTGISIKPARLIPKFWRTVPSWTLQRHHRCTRYKSRAYNNQ